MKLYNLWNVVERQSFCTANDGWIFSALSKTWCKYNREGDRDRARERDARTHIVPIFTFLIENCKCAIVIVCFSCLREMYICVFVCVWVFRVAWLLVSFPSENVICVLSPSFEWQNMHVYVCVINKLQKPLNHVHCARHTNVCIFAKLNVYLRINEKQRRTSDIWNLI